MFKSPLLIIGFLLINLFSTNVFALQSIGPNKQALLALKQQADQQANSDAFILNRTANINIDEKGFESGSYYNAIYIKNEAAIKDYSKLRSFFNAYYYDKTVDFARIITPNGEVLSMQDDAISLAATNNNDDYLDDGMQYEFALPQLVPGSIIEFQTSLKQKKAIIEGHWYSEINFYYYRFLTNRNWLRIDPVISTSNRVTLPKNLSLNIKKINTNVEPQVTQQANTMSYYWQNNNLPAVVYEANMPNLHQKGQSLIVSTIDDWQIINQWFYQLFKPTQTQNNEISALAQQLFLGKNSEREKIEAVFHYMQKNIRYIGAHVGRGGYKPHMAGDVLKHAYGDCKDQSVLIIALLKEANINAYPVMINTYQSENLYSDLVANNFNHMITFVEGEKDNYWLDTSGETGVFPGVFANLEGKKAFVVDGGKGRILTVKESLPSDNTATITVDYRFDANDLLKANIHLALTGNIDTNIRNYMQFSPEKLTAAEAVFSPFVYQHRLTDFEMTNALDVSQAFSLSAATGVVFTLTNDIENFTFSNDASAILQVFTHLSSLEAINNRQQDFYIPQSMQIKLIGNFYPPWQDAELVSSKPANNIENKFFTLTHEVEQRADKITSTSVFTLAKQTVKIADYASFYTSIQQLKKHASNAFVYKKPVIVSKEELPHEQSLEQRLKIVQSLLENAEIEKALTLVKSIVSQNEKNAQAQYLLGLAYGFKGQYELSEQALSKAQLLGYEL